MPEFSGSHNKDVNMNSMLGDAVVGQRRLADEIDDDCLCEDEVDFHLLEPVTQQLVQGYSQLLLLGVPPHAIARAMLGATLNFHAAYGLTGELPALLRAAADQLEFKGAPS